MTYWIKLYAKRNADSNCICNDVMRSCQCSG